MAAHRYLRDCKRDNSSFFVIVAEKDFFVDYSPTFEHDPIRYSKRVEGEAVLEALGSQVVSQHCTSFLRIRSLYYKVFNQ